MSVQDWESKVDNDIGHIAEELARGRINFLFGAGMSIQSGSIPGAELAFKLILEGFFKSKSEDNLEDDLEKQIRSVASKYPLEAIASGVEPELPFQETQLSTILKQVVFKGKNPELHDGHKHMAAIMQRLGTVRLLFTTNWDTLLEEALGNSAVTITNKKFHTLNLEEVLREKIGVVHLHGTFDEEPLIKETDLMSSQRPLFSLFLAELMAKSFVFVGYSLSDPNIRSLYFQANEILTNQRINLKKITYVVFPPSNDVDRNISSAVWLAPPRNAKYIPLAADEFFRRLYEQLEGKAMIELKKELQIRLSMTRDELNSKIEEIRSVFPDFATDQQVLGYLNMITKGGNK
jgi:hypothetical protein